MTLRHALEVLLEAATTPEEVEVEYVAVHIERALRAAAQEMAEMLTRVEADDWLIDQCVTAGVAAMVEEG